MRARITTSSVWLVITSRPKIRACILDRLWLFSISVVEHHPKIEN